MFCRVESSLEEPVFGGKKEKRRKEKRDETLRR
jgi:hypothetical protein